MPLLLVLLALLVLAVAQSSLLRLLPLSPALVTGYAGGALALALLPALLANGSPLPGALGVAVPVLAAASYEQSRLDWLRLLRDYGVADPGAPDALRLAIGLGALVAAWALHALDTAHRLRLSAASRGLPPAQAAAGARLVRRATARMAGIAVGGTALAALLALLAVAAGAGALLGGRGSLVAPLLAVGLVALAATLLWTERGARAR